MSKIAHVFTIIHFLFLGAFGQLGLGNVKKQSRPKLVKEIADEKVQILCCGSFETVSLVINWNSLETANDLALPCQEENTEARRNCIYYYYNVSFDLLQMVITLDQKFYKWGRNAQLIRQAVSDIFCSCLLFKYIVGITMLHTFPVLVLLSIMLFS